MRYLLWLPLVVTLVCSCTHYLDRNIPPSRADSPECYRYRQMIQSPVYNHVSSGPLYTPADQARLIQRYDAYGC